MPQHRSTHPSLHEKYLAHYQFSEQHAVNIVSTPEKIFAAVALFDFTASPWIRILMALRGIPGRFLKTNGLARYKFLELERRENDEIIIGLIGKFWTPSGSLQDFEPSAFSAFNSPGFAKATWNFKLTSTEDGTTLSTETRIFCTDENARRKFERYWFFVDLA